MRGASGSPRRAHLTAGGLEALLSRLDSDRLRAGEKYAACRDRLQRFFEWRGCENPDDLADETLDRVAQKLGSGLDIIDDDPLHYVYGVARFVSLEALKAQHRTRDGLDEYTRMSSSARADEDERGLLEDRVRHCLAALTEDQRMLLVRYYAGEGRLRIDGRERLARDLGLPMNAIRIRVHRLRERITACVRRLDSGHE